jgi:thiol-disulfide isomerase/thioredoxin
VIIDFMTTWCPFCQEIAPVYKEYANKYPAAVFLEVDAEELEVRAIELDRSVLSRTESIPIHIYICHSPNRSIEHLI